MAVNQNTATYPSAHTQVAGVYRSSIDLHPKSMQKKNLGLAPIPSLYSRRLLLNDAVFSLESCPGGM